MATSTPGEMQTLNKKLPDTGVSDILGGGAVAIK